MCIIKIRAQASYTFNFKNSNTLSNKEMSHIDLFTNVNSNMWGFFCFQWRIRVSERTQVPCWIKDFDQSRHRTRPHQDEGPSYQ